MVTDALNMGGVANTYGAEAAVRAFLAGADLLLQPADPRTAIDAMAAAVARGEITAAAAGPVGAAGAGAEASSSASSNVAPCRWTAFLPWWAGPSSRRQRATSPRARS